MKVTINDIAHEAGVSRSLVSFYLNNSATTRVAEKTRKRIDEAVKKLGYRRNELAAEIRTGVSKTVALLYDFNHPSSGGIAAGEIIRGLLAEAAEYDYGLKVYNTTDPVHNFDQILRYGISNVICFSFCPDYQHKIGDLCKKHKVNLCYLQESCMDDFPLVYSDDQATMRELVHRLYEQGHRRMALLIPEGDVHYSIDRRDGWLTGMEECGLKAEARFISIRRELQDHYQDIENMLKLPAEQRPSAFFCSDDHRAFQVQFMALRLGISIPDECEIIGYGNTNAFRSYYPMTTVEQHFAKIGTLAFNTVIHMEKEKNMELRRLLPTEIIHYAGQVARTE